MKEYVIWFVYWECDGIVNFGQLIFIRVCVDDFFVIFNIFDNSEFWKCSFFKGYFILGCSEIVNYYEVDFIFVGI